MNLSAPFIRRPVATTLLTAAVALSGAVAFILLPVSPLPQIDFPTISVGAGLPGGSPEVMASSVATPLERQFGRISSITEMTSSSTLGTTTITIQFDLNRNIDGAARDVQAAINAARAYLPANLPMNPTWRKVNPADAPIMIVALTSSIYDRGALYDAASTVLMQRLSQIPGVGQVIVGGGALPAVRVELNPTQLNSYGLGLKDVATLLSNQNANLAKGQFADDKTTADITVNDQLLKAVDYKPLILGYHNGNSVKLGDVADILDSVENVRAGGFANGKPSVLLIMFKQPDANIIDTVDRIKEALPSLKASVPTAIDFTTILDRTTTIRASVRDVERSLVISVALVILVVFLFLRNGYATMIPSVAVPVSLIGTFGIMYLCHFTLDNLSLMALTISTGFVVDDAIVVVENIARYLEQGLSPMEAAMRGAREICFTVLAMSTSLVAVFTPILLMGGIIGRMFREFAVTLSVAILVSLVVSLTTTPMMSSRLLKHHRPEDQSWFYRVTGKLLDGMLGLYERSLTRVLRHPALTLTVLLLTVVCNILLFVIVPKGFFPQQDTGIVVGSIQGAQDTSYQNMLTKLLQYVSIVKADEAVNSVAAFTGGNSATDTGFLYISLKPLGPRTNTVYEVINRLRPKVARVPGANAFFQAGQDLRIGGRQSQAQFQYTITSDNFQDLVTWAPRLLEKMKTLPGLTDANSDQRNHGLDAYLVYDRNTASRLGISAAMMDSTLYQAFGQAQVSTTYTPLNQYHVVMEVAPKYWQDPKGLSDVYLTATNGRQVPLSALTRRQTTTTPIAVNHQGQFPAVTLSFNLGPGVSLSDAVREINEMEQTVGMPSTIRGSFAGTALAYQASLSSEWLLIITALLAVYIVLGVLYESFVHPITILSTLPSAGVGAVLALMITHTELTVIALIGVILLIGLVKKNGILMIDFALAAEREEGKSPKDAIYQACLLRFRPILMTTLAAMLGAMPMVLGTGTGSELRRPLGIAIVGGLMLSQVLTLYTTPVVYLYLDRYSHWWSRVHRRSPRRAASPAMA
ncbi:MAG: multidrug efflux RND transporter permease subunit [Limisphaerales bacterium]